VKGEQGSSDGELIRCITSSYSSRSKEMCVHVRARNRRRQEWEDVGMPGLAEMGLVKKMHVQSCTLSVGKTTGVHRIN
jgi:hypothetical protein